MNRHLPAESKWDLFISHASEDKDEFVRPFATVLDQLGVGVWFDEIILVPGDSLTRRIDEGLANSQYGVVVLSPAFISKPWPEREYRGLVTMEIAQLARIIPIWHNVRKEQVIQFSPSLADIVALRTSEAGPVEIALQILRVVRPEMYDKVAALAALRLKVANASVTMEDPASLRPSQVRHATLPNALLLRIRIVHGVLSDILGMSLEEMIVNFRRDLQPAREVEHWERIAAAYLELTQDGNMKSDQKERVFRALLRIDLGVAAGDTQELGTVEAEAAAAYKRTTQMAVGMHIQESP